MSEFENIPKNIQDLIGRPLQELTGYLKAADYRLRADAACVIGDMLRDMDHKELPAETMANLYELLKDIEPKVRLEAAITLALLGDMAAAPILRELTWRRAFRLDAIHALGLLKDRDAIPLLRATLYKFFPSWAEKIQAAAALCAMGESEGADYLERRLRALRYGEKAAACHFIGESHHPKAFEILSDIAKNPAHKLRDTAIRTLGILGDERAIELLTDLYDGLPLILQEDAISSLKALSLSHKLPDRAKKILTSSGNS